MKRILIISSESTGGGHKSITEALKSRLLHLDSDIQINVVDGFQLGNRIFRLCADIYDPLAVHFPVIWGLIYQSSNSLKPIINFIVSRFIRRTLKKNLLDLRPDLIVSVNALFVGSVISVVREAGMDIPVVSMIADLDNVSDLWAEKQARWIICPTSEAKERMLTKDMPEDILYTTGFPVRAEFCNALYPATANRSAVQTGIFSILIICGSQGSNKVIRIVKNLIRLEHIHVTVIAGHNGRLKNRIERLFARYLGDKVTVYGFESEMEKRMSEADILIVRASPNVLMEAVNLCKPVIVVGALKGQEKENPRFIEKNGLGVLCRNVGDLPDTVIRLMKNNGEKLERIRKNQFRFRKPEAAWDISRLLIETAKGPKNCAPIVQEDSCSVSGARNI